MKNLLEGFKGSFEQAEKRFSKLRNRAIEIKEEKKRWDKNEQSLRDTIKWTNLYFVGVQKEKRDKGKEKLLEETMAENLQNLMKNMKINIQEIQ